MKKVLLVIAVLVLIAGCTKYASQEQLDELNARSGAVEALKSEIKSAQGEKADLTTEKEMLEDEIMKLEEEIAELEKKVK